MPFHRIETSPDRFEPEGNRKESAAPRASGSSTLPFTTWATTPNDRWRVLGICVFLGAITWLVFGQTLRYEFVNFDDVPYVLDNSEVARGLTTEGVVWAFTHAHAASWHPVTWLSHMLDCQLYGLKPSGHHLTNVLLHIATAILLFMVLRQTTAAFWRSATVAAIFAIHPLRVESVAWVAERKDVLSGLFFMLTLGAYARYARQPWSPGRLWTRGPDVCNRPNVQTDAGDCASRTAADRLLAAEPVRRFKGPAPHHVRDSTTAGPGKTPVLRISRCIVRSHSYRSERLYPNVCRTSPFITGR